MECVSFPRAGCGKSACPVRRAGRGNRTRSNRTEATLRESAVNNHRETKVTALFSTLLSIALKTLRSGRQWRFASIIRKFRKGSVLLRVQGAVFLAAAQNHGIATPATSSVGDREEIIRLERTSWEAVKHKDKATLSGLLAEGYFDFGSDGRYDAKKSLSTG